MNSGRKFFFSILKLVGQVCLFLGLFTSHGSTHPDPLENIKIYNYILSISPENPHVYLNRGICSRLVADYGKAISDFNHAESLGIRGRPLWMNRAMAYLSLKQYEDSLTDVSRIIRDNPQDSTSLYYRGEIYFKQGNYRLAIEDYTNAMVRQKSPYLYFVRADAYRMVGEMTAALEDYTKAIGIAAHIVPFRIARAKVLASLKRYQEARQDLDDAIKAQPERYQVYTERAILSASQGLDASRAVDLNLALKYVEDELFFRPRDPSVFAERSRIREWLGELGKAQEDLDQAVDLSQPNDSTYLRQRAAFRTRHQQNREATADLTYAAEVDNRPIPTATPLPGPTLSLDELSLQPTPNLLPELQR